MTGMDLQGWYADPFGRHEARYFSAGRPTKLVRDGQAEAFDEPSGTYSGPVRQVGEGDPEPAGHVAIAAPVRRRASVYAGFGVLAVVVIVAAVLLGKADFAGPRTPALSAAAFVTQSAQRTLTAGTADVTVSGWQRAGSQAIPVHGSGEVDFAANSMAIRMSLRASGQSIAAGVIQINGYFYFTVSIDGRATSPVPGGRHWVQTPVQQSGTATLGGSDPSAALAALARGGNAVRTLGTTMIGGVACTGYSVTPSRQAMVAAVREETAAGKFSARLADAELKVTQLIPVPTYSVWFDANELMRQLSVNMRLGGLTSAAGGDLVLRFSNYGAPVRIAAPAPSDVLSYSSYLKAVRVSVKP
jgi:hypothetical protein